MPPQLNDLKDYKTKERWQVAPVATTPPPPHASDREIKTAPSSATPLAPASVSQLAPAHVSQLAPASVSQLAPASVTQLAPAHVSQLAPASVSQLAPASVSQLAPVPVSAMTYGLYSWSCYNHDVSSSSAFYTMTVDEGG